MPIDSPNSQTRRLVLQLVGSVLVIALLLRGSEGSTVLATLGGTSWVWLLAALLLKIAALTVREARLYVAIRPWHQPSFMRILGIGFASGLVNNAVPARGGDLLAVALLRRECGVSTTAAVTAVAVTSIVEALVFGVLLLGLMLGFRHHWELFLGAPQAARAVGALTGLTAATVFGAAVLVVLARRLGPPATAPSEPVPAAPPGLAARLRGVLGDLGTGVGLWPLLLNTLLAVVQIGLVVGTLLVLFKALGLQVEAPMLAVCFFVAAGSLVAVILPPSMGAGGAAASVLVLALFGLSDHEALAFAALAWFAHIGPAVAVGIIPLWRRLGSLSLAVAEEDPGLSADDPG